MKIPIPFSFKYQYPLDKHPITVNRAVLELTDKNTLVLYAPDFGCITFDLFLILYPNSDVTTYAKSVFPELFI